MDKILRRKAAKPKPAKTKLPLYIRALGRDKTRGIVQIGALRLPCALGRGGISAFKREGDGKTPRAKLRIIGGFHSGTMRAAPRAALPLRRTKAQDGWCDAADDRNYNRFVRLPYPKSAEKLRRADALYTVSLVLDWNICPRVKGRGSAVFFHIARARTQSAAEGTSLFSARRSHAAKLYHPTAGCIAVSARNMRRLLPHLTLGTEIFIL